jgi:hypothetical protein
VHVLGWAFEANVGEIKPQVEKRGKVKVELIKMVPLSKPRVRNAREAVERLRQRWERVPVGRSLSEKLRDAEYWRALDWLDEFG